MSYTCSVPWIRGCLVLLIAWSLAACSVNTTVSVGAATPAQVQHLYVTVQGVWLNTDAATVDASAATVSTAAPTGAGWVGKKLSSPLTIDLTTLNGGTLTDLVSGLNTAPGTYRRLRLDLADSSASLTSSARAAGLSWNAQVQYLSTTGVSLALPLELPSAASQLIIPVSIEIQGGGAAPILAGSMLNGGTSSTDTGGFFMAASTLNGTDSVSAQSSLAGSSSTSDITTNSAAGASSDAATTGSSASSGLDTTGGLTNSTGATVAVTSGGAGTTVTTARVALDIQAVRRWILFDYDGSAGAMLDPRILAYDADKVGGITGTLDMSAAAAATLTGPQGIVVTAEKLSTDGTRYEPVKSVSVSSSGAFTLYPLPVDDSGSSTPYEIVIHGPGIRSIVISQVPVKAGAASVATSVQGTAVALTKARHYTVNAAANSAPLPGGSRVGFFQTVPGFAAPHVIEYAATDPFNGGFTDDVSLSADVVDHGVYADGGSVRLTSSAPDEGVGTYRIGADAALRAPSALANTITAPTLSSSGVQPIFLPAVGAALGGGTLRLNGTLSLARPGRFDRGFVLISRGGELIDAVDVKASLSGPSATATFALSSIPASSADGRYDVSLRLWNSRDPAGTLTRVAANGRLDASGGGVQTVNIAVP